jgi:hypothetical protein
MLMHMPFYTLAEAAQSFFYNVLSVNHYMHSTEESKQVCVRADSSTRTKKSRYRLNYIERKNTAFVQIERGKDERTGEISAQFITMKS